MNDELKNNNGDIAFGDEPEKKEIAVAGETAVSEAKTEENSLAEAAEGSSKELAAEDVVNEEKALSNEKVFAKHKKLEKGTVAYEVFDWLRTICIGILAGIFIVVFLVQKDNVYGDSMYPTLSSGDAIFTQKLSTYFKSYKRGDIVILDGSNMEGYYGKEYLVKRVVALPGETVKIENGNVYIKPAGGTEFYQLVENYLPTGTKTTMMDDGMKRGYNEVTLGEDEYFCLGDNRPVSNDSRNLGPFSTKRIKAVAVIRIYPFNEIKIIN